MLAAVFCRNANHNKMTTSELIEKLQQMPQDKIVCIFDYLENEKDDDGDGSTTGFYEEFDVDTLKNEEDGLEIVVLAFKNKTIE